MNKWFFIIIIISILSVWSCVEYVELAVSDDVGEELTVNAYACAGEKVVVRVGVALGSTEKVIIQPKDVVVELSVNGEEYEKLSKMESNEMVHLYNTYIDESIYTLYSDELISNCFITSSYVSREGDELSIRVFDESHLYDTLTASTVVIGKNPEFGIKSVVATGDEVFIGKAYNFDTAIIFDDIYSIDCFLQDPPNEKNHYFLDISRKQYVRSILDNWWSLGYNLAEYKMRPFLSDALIFKDHNITMPIGIFKEGFSNVFDDSLFDGELCEFTIQTRRAFPHGEFMITCYSISESLYKYLKTAQYALCSENDIFSTPIHLHSNVSGGRGIFGSLSKTAVYHYGLYPSMYYDDKRKSDYNNYKGLLTDNIYIMDGYYGSVDINLPSDNFDSCVMYNSWDLKSPMDTLVKNKCYGVGSDTLFVYRYENDYIHNAQPTFDIIVCKTGSKATVTFSKSPLHLDTINNTHTKCVFICFVGSIGNYMCCVSNEKMFLYSGVDLIAL